MPLGSKIWEYKLFSDATEELELLSPSTMLPIITVEEAANYNGTSVTSNEFGILNILKGLSSLLISN